MLVAALSGLMLAGCGGNGGDSDDTPAGGATTADAKAALAASTKELQAGNFGFTAASKPCQLTGLASLEDEPRTDYRHVIMLMRLPT